jgi:membrane associated rhomboid family serine protease
MPILVLNIIVFLMWNTLGESDFMAQNFLVSWTALAEGRIWTLVTSEFSHIDFWHIFVNMYVFYMFGSVLESALGTRVFLNFYLTACIVSSISHSLISAWLLQQPDLPALGASGAVSGAVLLFALLFPREKIFLFGIIPLPALVAAFLFVGLDLWGLMAQTAGGGLPIGHGAHLGGALTGFLFYVFFIRRSRRS